MAPFRMHVFHSIGTLARRRPETLIVGDDLTELFRQDPLGFERFIAVRDRGPSGGALMVMGPLSTMQLPLEMMDLPLERFDGTPAVEHLSS